MRKSKPKIAFPLGSKRECKICNNIKELFDFSPSSNKNPGFRNMCKSCAIKDSDIRRRAIVKLWKEGKLFIPPERQCAKCNKILPANNFGKTMYTKIGLYSYCKSCDSEKHFKLRRQPERHKKLLWYSARTRAIKNNLKFDIKIEDIVIPKKCPVFGFILKVSPGKIDRKHSPSIDRINNKKGYTKDNIIVVSYLANALKSNATPKQLRSVADFYSTL